VKFKGINLCQPDSEKGCCACCGLFNFYDIRKDSITAFLNGAVRRLHDESAPAACDGRAVRDPTSHICPYQGFVQASKPGCLLHPEIMSKDMRDRSLFGATICDDFVCIAYEILSIDEKRALIENIHDWYLYSIAIVDPDSFSWIVEQVNARCAHHQDGVKSRGMRERCIKSALTYHAEFLNSLKIPLFSYSLSEYNLNKKSFSLRFNSGSVQGHRERLMSALDKEMVSLR
jgi:hypothetical protein